MNQEKLTLLLHDEDHVSKLLISLMELGCIWEAFERKARDLGLIREETGQIHNTSSLSWRRRQNLLLTSLGLHGDDVNPKSDDVTLADKEKPIDDSAG
ncbi:hypothetical protein Tco_0729905 [Tanacetum coccineum]|uniref:Uncharacterized protein n=1 Tax=Tanacetum coccineum TaxID=301880 RepID=A0ABQ4YQ77_9ASTR